MRYAFPDGVAGATDIEDNITRGLQFARNLGLNPTETLGLINRALPAGQFIAPNQLQAAVEPRAGLLALAQPRVGPSVSFRREFGKVSDIPIRTVPDYKENPALAGAGGVKGGSGAYGIDIVSPSIPGQTRDVFAEGGTIHYDKGGDVAYTLADFGISTPSVAGTLSVPRNVVFNKALEAAEKGKIRTGLSDLIDLQNLAIRQGRTDRDYIDLLSRVADSYGYSPSQFGRIEARGPATSDIRTYNPYYFAEGGDVGRGLGSIAMKGYAQEMAQKGRFGDTMLAHISPEEAQMLQAAGGAGTINPETGLPEYFSWRKILKGVAKVAPFVVPFVPGLGLAAKALISGVAGGLGGQKGFDFKRGLMSGLMSYGIGSAAQNLGLTSGAAPTGAEAVAPQAAIDTAKAVTDPNVMGGSAMFQAPQGYGTSMMDFPSTPSFEASSTVPSDFAKEIMTPSMPTSDLGSFNASPGTPPVTEPSALDTIKAKISPSLEKAQTVLDKPIDTMYALPMAVSSAAMVSEGDKAAQAIAAQQEEEDRKKRLGAQLFAETLGRVPVRGASGGMAGIGALAAGGATGSANEPRTINGAGDGMSDSVPATIEGIQEARLADGEFVIPADVVADLGNGSSNAGSKKLYAMMDRVRKARHGTTRQPPEVDMGRLMPA
jgi:hypothetical protein